MELRFDLGLDMPGRKALRGEALGCEGHHSGLDIDNVKTRESKKEEVEQFGPERNMRVD